MVAALLFVTSVALARQDGSVIDLPPGASYPDFIGRPADPKPLAPKDVEPNPYLAPQSSMHADMYNSCVVDQRAPLGRSPVVRSRAFGPLIGMCLNFFYDERENLFAFCGTTPDGLLGGEIEFQLALMDPETLDKTAVFPLLTFTFAQLIKIPLEFGYMNLDSEGRLIVIDANNQVLFVGLEDGAEPPRFAVTKTIDLSAAVDPAADKVASVVPDFDGNYWFMTLGEADEDGAVTTPAVIGVAPADGSGVVVHSLEGEVVENGLAIGPDGVFAISDRATYGFRWDAVGRDAVTMWREEYERSTVVKPGVISPYGSGATPTLLGDRYLVMTDNADVQVNLLVYDRREDAAGDRVVCKVPLFAPGFSANENSPIVHGRSVFVQNWYNAPRMIFGDAHDMMPGLVRVDVREDESGCDVIWENPDLAAPGTAKLSTATGLIYGTSLDKAVDGAKVYYLHGIDFETGETVFRVRTGTGALADGMYVPVYIGPDGTLYQPVLSGTVAVSDGEPWPGEDDDDDDVDLVVEDDDDEGCGA